MSLSISTEQNCSKQENTVKLVGEYLRGVVREMRKVDYAARFFDELPKRHHEKAVAEKYVRQNPLRVKNTAVAEQAIKDTEKFYKAETGKASLRTKADYALGETYKTVVTKTLLGGAAMVAGGLLAVNGARPEAVAVVAAVGMGAVVAGGSVIRAVQGTAAYEANRRENAKKLDKYTEAKEALYALKLMKRQLKAQQHAETKTAVLAALNMKSATR